MEHKHELALVCGRFQHIHNGHVEMINRALEVAEKVLVLIGSSQESGTNRNPFSYEMRARLVRLVYPTERIVIAPLPDMTNEDDVRPEWGRYVLQHVRKEMHRLPDVLVYGDDENRRGWFAPEDLVGIDTVTIPHDTVPIHATKLRAFIANHQFEEWREFVPTVIHPLFGELYKQLKQVSAYASQVIVGKDHAIES